MQGSSPFDFDYEGALTDSDEQILGDQLASTSDDIEAVRDPEDIPEEPADGDDFVVNDTTSTNSDSDVLDVDEEPLKALRDPDYFDDREPDVDVDELSLSEDVDLRITADLKESVSGVSDLKWFTASKEPGDNELVHVRVLRDDSFQHEHKYLIADRTAATLLHGDLPDSVEVGDEVVLRDVVVREGRGKKDQWNQVEFVQESDVNVLNSPDKPVWWFVDVDDDNLANACMEYDIREKHEARQQVVEELLESYRVSDVSGTDLCWIYDDDEGVWVRDASEELDSILSDVLPPVANTSRERSEIISTVKALSRVRENPITVGTPEDPDLQYKIGVENGVIDLREPVEDGECLQDFSPEYKLTDRHKLPVEFDPDAECPEIHSVLEDISNGTYFGPEVIYEAFGHALMRNYNQRQAIAMVGKEETGKSFVMTLLKWFVGSEKVEDASLDKLTKGKFETAALKGSLAVVDDDATKNKLKDASFFKKAIGTGGIRVDEKMIPRESIDNHAKVWFAANHPPLLGSTAEGLVSRLLVLVFNQQFSDDPGPDQIKKIDDSELRERLDTPEEMAGLLNESIKGAQRLMDDGWSIDKTQDEMWGIYKNWADDVERALSKCFVEAPDAEMKKGDVYAVYAAYTNSLGIDPSSKSQFWKIAHKSSVHFETGWWSSKERSIEGLMLSPQGFDAAPSSIQKRYGEVMDGRPGQNATESVEPIDSLTPGYATVEGVLKAKTWKGDQYSSGGRLVLVLQDDTGAVNVTGETDREAVQDQFDAVEPGDRVRVSNGHAEYQSGTIEIRVIEAFSRVEPVERGVEQIDDGYGHSLEPGDPESDEIEEKAVELVNELSARKGKGAAISSIAHELSGATNIDGGEARSVVERLMDDGDVLEPADGDDRVRVA